MHVKYVKIVSALSTMKRTLSARKVTQYSKGIIRVQRFPKNLYLTFQLLWWSSLCQACRIFSTSPDPGVRLWFHLWPGIPGSRVGAEISMTSFSFHRLRYSTFPFLHSHHFWSYQRQWNQIDAAMPRHNFVHDKMEPRISWLRTGKPPNSNQI